MRGNTYFIDIDGTILEHKEKGAAEQWYGKSKVIEGSRERLSQLEHEGHHIVLVTARPQSMRYQLEDELKALRIVFHQLVCGITAGTRYLINDAKPGDGNTAVAITVPRNEGIVNV